MSAKNPNIKTHKYKVSVTITKLRLCTKSALNLKIQWKRNDSSSQTPLISHKNQSTFEDKLVIEFGMYYDTIKKQYMEKKTDLNVVIQRDGVVKSGGTVRVDLAEQLNKKQLKSSYKLPLNKCPDTSAYIEFILDFELESNNESIDASLMDMSMSNTSFQGFGSQSSISNSNFLSQNFFQLPKSNKPTKDKSSPGQLTTIVNKFESLLGKLKSNNRVKYLDRSNTSSARGEKQQLNDKIQELQQKNRMLQRQVDKKSTQILEKSRELEIYKIKYNPPLCMMITNTNLNNYKTDLIDKAKNYHSLSRNESVIKGLEEQKYELQDQVAKISRNMGQLFNAAFQIGGAQLLDELQAAIGLIENH